MLSRGCRRTTEDTPSTRVSWSQSPTGLHTHSLGPGLWPTPQNQSAEKPPPHQTPQGLGGSSSLRPAEFGVRPTAFQGFMGLRSDGTYLEWLRAVSGVLHPFIWASRCPRPAGVGQPSPPQREWPAPIPAGLAMPLTPCPSALSMNHQQPQERKQR